MNNFFISKIKIENVRHLKNIIVPLSNESAKHVIFTGKNGSGKTSVLESLSNYLNALATTDRIEKAQIYYNKHKAKLDELYKKHIEDITTIEEEKTVERYAAELQRIKSGIDISFSEEAERLRYYFEKGQFVLAYYKAERVFHADVPKHVEKVNLKDKYAITEEPRQMFIKYMLDLKVTEALARSNGNIEKAINISQWFNHFQDLLRRIFDDTSLELVFEEDTFKFFIKEKNRELFDFNTLSSGFAAVLDIVLDIIVRMEKATNKTFNFNIPGIVLIDEIETHLHMDLQKNILDLLISIFPNIQFIISTHSPFILNSLDNVVIYDLENSIIVENGLSNIPYSGIVEGYFKANAMSETLKRKYERYKELIVKEILTDDDFDEIADLELFLNEIPDYLALDITTEYQRLKINFEDREDL